jgi:hypothetical protein
MAVGGAAGNGPVTTFGTWLSVATDMEIRVGWGFVVA